MYLKEFDVETWMTNHEQNCQYNLADTCVSDMSLHELESLIHKDLMVILCICVWIMDQLQALIV